MRIAMKHVEGLARQVLEDARKALDAPAVQNFLDRVPGGQVIREMIGHPAPPPVAFDPVPSMYSPPVVPAAIAMATTPEPVRVEPLPPEKVARRVAGRLPATEPPVPVGTRIRILTGAFTGWTGPLQWSPAKSAYNVRLTGPDGQQTRTTLSPSRLGKSWQVDCVAASAKRPATSKRQEVRA